MGISNFMKLNPTPLYAGVFLSGNHILYIYFTTTKVFFYPETTFYIFTLQS